MILTEVSIRPATPSPMEGHCTGQHRNQRTPNAYMLFKSFMPFNTNDRVDQGPHTELNAFSYKLHNDSSTSYQCSSHSAPGKNSWKYVLKWKWIGMAIRWTCIVIWVMTISEQRTGGWMKSQHNESFDGWPPWFMALIYVPFTSRSRDSSMVLSTQCAVHSAAAITVS